MQKLNKKYGYPTYYSAFLSDASEAQFGLPKSYMTKGMPVARGVATRLHVRRTARGLSQVKPSNKVIMTRTLKPKNYGLRLKLGT